MGIAVASEVGGIADLSDTVGARDGVPIVDRDANGAPRRGAPLTC